MKKRLFGILVAVVLLLCVTLPLAALADGLAALDWIEISGVQIPEVGAMPTIEGIEIAWPAEQQGSLSRANWYYYNEDGGYTELNEPFFGAQWFYLELIFDMPEGTEFGEETIIMVPREADNYYAYDNVIEMEFYLPGESITEVSVTGVPETIEVGQQASIDTISISADANYILYPIWEEFTEGEWFVFRGVFKENGLYRLNLEFYPNAGYQMDVEEVYINGELAEFYGQSNSWMGVEILFPLTEEITEVELMNVPELVAGNSSDLSELCVPENAGYEITFARWFDADTNEAVTGIFEKGKAYRLEVELQTKAGYHFTEYPLMFVNGIQTENYWNDLNSLSYMYEGTLKELYHAVDITGIVAPVIGEVPTTEGVSAGDCDVVCFWMDGNGNPVEVFQNHNRYYLQCFVYPPAGYRFEQGVTQVTVDGTYPGSEVYFESECITLRMVYSFCEPISKVSVKAPEVEIGQKIPFTAEVSVDANYYTEINWYVWSADGGYMACQDGVFEEGVMYNMDLYIFPKDGYGFDPLTTQIEVAGADPVITMYEDYIYCMANYDFSTSPKIEKVELLNVPMPEIGKPATIEGLQIPSNANYIIDEISWVELEELDLIHGELKPAETFQAGKYYVLAVVLQAKPGYTFDWKVPVYVNGEKVDILFYGGNCFDVCVLPVVFEPMGDEEVAGDFNSDGVFNNDDVVYLMWCNLFPDAYPLANGDVNGDGVFNNDDVVYLMWHNLFPENYPL